jgi:hypothetical protein
MPRISRRINLSYAFILAALLSLAFCRDHPDSYTVVKYEWRASKQMDNISTAAYTIRHGRSILDTECIGTSDTNGFHALTCSPPLPVGEELSMRPDGHELICSIHGKEVHLEVISEELN